MLTLYNSLSRKKESFTPKVNKDVSLYICGITPYDTTHLGHAFTYISFDVLVRFLSFQGYKVSYTQNVTDINDRDNDILKKAKEQDIPWQKLATFWTKKFLLDMESLNWIKPTAYLKASENIPSMTSLIEQIVARGYGYIVKGNVYLDIEKVSNFGELSRLTKEHMLIKAKEFEEDLANPNKKHPLDITLWRAEEQQPPHIPSFFSTFGKGRPGWHIECSAMAISSLGEQIDIHGGGYDLIFPHHESEIAQSETATGKIPFVKYWMHTGTVHINGKKMSKSLGNLILVSDLLKTYSPNALRFLFLSHHYREPWNFNEQELKDAQKTCDLIENLLSDDDVSSRKESYKKKVISYLSNDLDTPSVLLETVKESQKKTKNTKEIKDILTMLGFTF